MAKRNPKDLIEAYDDSQVEIYEGLKHILKRPSMYLGSLDTPQHTLEEALMNSLDEVKLGVANEINIVLHKDHSISIRDNGRGIPPQHSDKFGMPTARALLTVPNTGKGLAGAVSTSSSQNGIGMKATVATAEWMDVKIWRNGTEWTDRYELKGKEPGVPVVKLKGRELPSTKAPKDAPEHGTYLHWMPNSNVFDSLDVRVKDIVSLCEFQTYLNPGLKITVEHETKKTVHELQNPGGLPSLIGKLAETSDSKLITPVYQFPAAFDTGVRVRNDEGEDEPVVITATVAYAWSDAPSHQTMLYTNNVPNPNGGTPIRGSFAGVSKLINKYAKELSMSKATIEQRDILPGLILVLDITHPNPQFEGQTKKEVTSKDAMNALSTMVVSGSELLYDRNIEPIKAVIKAALARAAARKKEEESKVAVSKSEANKALSKKLEPARNTGAGSGAQLFIVEGDSAGGTVIEERDVDSQAVIPLRGKILNTWKASPAKAMSNAEIVAMVTAMGTGVGDDFDIEKRNYDKIIITSDQDPDGSHISCLILTAILKYMPQLLVEGYVYRVMTPLYVNSFKSKPPRYTYSNREQEAFLKTREGKAVTKIKRNKGIGEVSADLVHETIINKSTRRLLRYRIKEEFMDDALAIVDSLMGDESAPRKAIFFNPDIYELVEE